MKKIIIDIKDLVIGFKEILSSIIPNIKSEKIIINVSIELTSFVSPKMLIKLKLSKKISKIKIINKLTKKKIPPFKGVGFLCNFLILLGTS